MKRTLYLTLVLLCTGSTLHAAVGDTLNLTNGYIAEGVAATFTNGIVNQGRNELVNSTRFYDSQKGWVAGAGADSSMCWAHTASNMIQYWQSYYGVFYKNNITHNVALPYGSDYKRELYNIMSPNSSPIITDPLRLNVMKALYDSGFKNGIGEVATATNWFFTWVAPSSKGGYYSDYFGKIGDQQANTPNQTAINSAISSPSNLKDALLSALGISATDGIYKQKEKGLIAHINITSDGGSHTLTCYGFTLSDDGSIKSVLIADSDDFSLPSYEASTGSTGTEGTYTPKLTQLFILTDENEQMQLYTNEDCTTPYGSTSTYHINGVTQINTPEVLQNMLAEYSDTTNEAQVWNGGATEWSAQSVDTNTLPDQSTGWDILVDGENISEEHRGYYHTYAADGRAVLLDSYGMNSSSDTQDITIVGTITPGSITVKDGGNYRLKAGSDASLAGSGDVNIGSNGRLTSELSLGSRSIKAAQGGHFSYALSSDTELTGTIAADSGGTVQFRNSSDSAEVTYSIQEWAQANASVQALKGKLIVGDANDAYGTNLDLMKASYQSTLTLEELTLYSGSSLESYNDTVVKGTFSALLNTQLAETAPLMKWNLDLSQATTLIMETSVDMGEHTLFLGNSVKALTLSNEMFPLVTYSEESELSAVLFTNVASLSLAGSTVIAGEWAAADYFASSAITDTTRLVLADGILSLQGLSIPEPSVGTLGLLTLAGFAARRRHR